MFLYSVNSFLNSLTFSIPSLASEIYSLTFDISFFAIVSFISSTDFTDSGYLSKCKLLACISASLPLHSILSPLFNTLELSTTFIGSITSSLWLSKYVLPLSLSTATYPSIGDALTVFDSPLRNLISTSYFLFVSSEEMPATANLSVFAGIISLPCLSIYPSLAALSISIPYFSPARGFSILILSISLGEKPLIIVPLSRIGSLFSIGCECTMSCSDTLTSIWSFTASASEDVISVLLAESEADTSIFSVSESSTLSVSGFASKIPRRADSITDSNMLQRTNEMKSKTKSVLEGILPLTSTLSL